MILKVPMLEIPVVVFIQKLANTVKYRYRASWMSKYFICIEKGNFQEVNRILYSSL